MTVFQQTEDHDYMKVLDHIYGDEWQTFVDTCINNPETRRLLGEFAEAKEEVKDLLESNDIRRSNLTEINQMVDQGTDPEEYISEVTGYNGIQETLEAYSGAREAVRQRFN